MECVNSKSCLIWVSRGESLKLTGLPWKLVDLENYSLITFRFKVSFASSVVLLLMEDIRKSPVEVGSLSHYLQGFKHPRWCRIFYINSFILPFKLSSYVFWVCSNCGAFAWHSSNKQRSPSHHERQMFQVFMGPKEKFSWNPSRALEGVVGRKLPSKKRLWVELMGATLEKRTNKFWMPNYQHKSSLFSKEFSYTVVLGYLQITLQKIRMIPSTTAPQPTNLVSLFLFFFAHLPTAEANATSATKCWDAMVREATCGLH